MALRKVADLKLDGCMPGCGAYSELLTWKGGLVYQLAMPCAPSPRIRCRGAVLRPG